MKNYLAIGAFALLFAVGGVVWFFFVREVPAATAQDVEKVLRVDFSGEGTLIKKETGGWLFQYQESGGTTYAVPLFFSEISMCAWKETAGRCRPSAFVEGRMARIEGADIGGGIGVVMLTFLDAPPAR